MNRLRSFLALPLSQQRRFLAIYVRLHTLSASLRVKPVRHFLAVAEDPRRRTSRKASAMDAATSARLIDMAARHALWPISCLPRALLLHHVLARDGIAARLRIGVRLDHGRFAAHAWVEWDSGQASAHANAAYLAFDRLAP